METRCGILIPTVWTLPDSGTEGSEDMSIHPRANSVREPGPLDSLLESAVGLEADPELLVLAWCPREKGRDRMLERVRESVGAFEDEPRIHLITRRHMERFRGRVADGGAADLVDLIGMDRFPELLNFGLLIAAVRGLEVLGLVRDRMEFCDPSYMRHALERLGGTADGSDEEIHGLAGLYAEGAFEGSAPSWMSFWNRPALLRDRLQRLRDRGEDLQLASFVLPGNVVVDEELYRRVPFDPACPRGPELDWFVNARLFGYRFYMDSGLRVRSRAPGGKGTRWQWLRRDARRYLYLRRKVQQMQEKLDIQPDYLEPWPGRFLQSDLEDRVFRTSLMLSQQYMIEGRPEHARRCLDTIYQIQHEFDPGDPLDQMQAFQNRWQRLMLWIRDHRDSLQETLFESSAFS